VLAHELAHVVQQERLPAPVAGGAVPNRQSDASLEQRAHLAGQQFANGRSTLQVPLGAVSGSAPVSQHFTESEHRAIGDLATTGPLGETRTVALAPDYRVTYGELLALSGDHFESIDELRRMALRPGPGADTREEIEYVRRVKVLGQSPAGFTPEAMRAADQRYYRLAADNPTHFPAPDKGDPERLVDDRLRDEAIGVGLQLFPLRIELFGVPRNAIAAYHRNHVRALVEAAQAGAAGASIDTAMAAEAFSNHFLTDSFAGGHVRNPRRAAFEHWNSLVPMFADNLQGYLAQKVAEALSAGSVGWLRSTEGFYHEGVPGVAPGTLTIIREKFAEKGVALSFGHVVVMAIHDYDNEHGVGALVAGREVLLKGDSHLGEGDERRLAVMAAQASIAEVESAYRLGKARLAARAVPDAILTKDPDYLFAAERMLPRPVRAGEQSGRIPPTPEVPWDFPSYAELLGDPLFDAALNTFAKNKAAELTDLVAGERDEAKSAIGAIANRLKGGQAGAVLREIIEWVPDTGGKAFGRLEDANAIEYINQAAATPGGLRSLTVSQRVKLIRFLLSGITVRSEEDAAFRVLTADPAQTRAVIDQVGWERLEDELGDRFSSAFPRR
jgi:hypothetical protein